MRFSAPAALLLLLFIPYLIWLGTPRYRSGWRQWSALAVRLGILILISLSLAGTRLLHAADELAVVFLIDASDSVEPEQRQRVEEYVREVVERLGPEEQAAAILFGANALVERPMSGLAEMAPISSLPQTLHTDIAEAMRLGLALFPAGSARRMVIFSDGAQTLGDAQGAAELAAASGVAIDVVPLERPARGGEVTLQDVRAPGRVRDGESFDVDVAVESTMATEAELQVLAGGSLVYREGVRLNPGANNFVISLQATEQQFARYEVRIVAGDDGFYQNNRLAVFTQVVGPPNLLLVAEQSAPAGASEEGSSPAVDAWQQLQLALAATGMTVNRIAPSQLPADLESLSQYDSIVMVDVNAKTLSSRAMESLRSYVRDLGGGLITVGGPESYGMGGYYRTPLEEMLPVDMQIKDQERFPAVSMALVIDRSGSMSAMEGSVSKIQLAAEGAARTVELLNDFDEITILPVDTAPDQVIGPVSAAERGQIISQVRQLGAGGGGIYVRTGLEAAAEALSQSANQIKHIILLADGADSEQKEGVPELIEALASQGVTISTVSIGDGPDVSWLREMAALGGGRFHFTDRASNLPQIFTQETTAIQRSYLVEERFFPALGQTGFARQHPIFQAMERAGITRVPPLYGYVGTSSKQTAQLILETHLGDPLLAVWEYGLGRTVAWTSDATGRWAIDWVGWPGFPTFWSNLVRWTIGQDSGDSLEADVNYSGEEAVLTVEARSGDEALLNELALEATVVGPSGEITDVSLRQVGPGLYEGAFLPSVEGAYLIRVVDQTGDQGQRTGQITGWVLGYSPEYSQLTGDEQLLTTVAQLTGGRDLSAQFDQGDFDAVLDHDLPAGKASQPIWPWLLLAAVVLLPLDIALRRIVLTRSDIRRLWQVTAGRLGRPARPDGPPSEQVARLFKAKERAARPPASEPADRLPMVTVPGEAEGLETRAPGGVAAARDAGDPGGADEAPDEPAGESYESLASRLLERRKHRNSDGT
jgi:uncharacterized membrane protein